MSPLKSTPSAGHYAQKQLFSPSRLIAWSHRRRFEAALQMARPFAGKTILDLGCGDGTFLELLMQQDWVPARAIGAEISEELVDDCRERLGAISKLSFLTDTALDDPRHNATFDGIFCMEVLEHVVDLPPVLDRLQRLLAPDGRLVVSVPVETGPTVVLKQAARRIAGWRGVGDYPGTSPYTLGELAAAIVAGASQHIVRPVHTAPDGTRFHDHKGFNWMALRDRLNERFLLEHTRASPIEWLTPRLLASQMWFVARARHPRA